MENMMKRAISAFMALVLVLGMVPGIPMFAGAEEVQTLPETEAVAVETTAPVTVPEETEAPETTPVEESEEETVPQETVFEETVPEETVVEETVVEETVPEVSEEAADAGDVIVLPTKLEVTASKKRTYVGDDVKLTAAFSPEAIADAEVEWIITGGEYHEEGPAKNILRGLEPGKFTVKGVYRFVNEKDEEVELTSEPITVEFVDYWLEINEAPIPEENIEKDVPFYILKSGASMPLSVKLMSQGVEDEEPKVEKNGALSDASVTWTMRVMRPTSVDEETGYATSLELTDENAALYMTCKAGTDPREAVFTANLVSEYQYILITAEDKVAGTAPNGIVVCLYPNSYKLYITDENGKDVTNGTITLDTADPEADLTQLLTAKVWPIQGDEKLVWEASDTLVKLEHELEDEKDTQYDNLMNFTANLREGKTVITVKGVTNPDLKATVTIDRVRRMQAIELSRESAKITELMAGKSATFKAVEKTEARDFVDNKLLKWELAPGDENYATISSSGVLKAKNVAEGRVVTVRCSIIGNEKAAPIEHLVIIRPKGVSVSIFAGDFAGGGEARSLDWTTEVNGMTIPVDTEEIKNNKDGMKLYAIVNNYVEQLGAYAAGDPVGAKQGVTWKSSNTSIAKIDPVTDAIHWAGKTGTVTITATANDGSGKSASVKLAFGTRLRYMKIAENGAPRLRSGESWTYSVECYPENATNKAVTWAVYAWNEEDGDYTANASSIAAISSGGKLSAKTVYDNQMVLIVATSKEDPDITAAYEVMIRPKNPNTLTILDSSDKCVTKTTIQLDVGESESLSALQVGDFLGDYFDPGAEWKSSNGNVVYVEDGYIEALKVGSATITAKIDGQSASVTVKVVSRVDDIEVYEKNDIHVLASGKSLSLKATVIDNETATEKNPNGKPTVSKVTWHIPEEYAHLATVNASGKVTAVKGYTGYPEIIEVYAKSTDGGNVKSNYYEICIFPAVEAMRVDLLKTDEYGGVETDENGKPVVICSSSYTHYLLNPGAETLQLAAVTHPELACDDVTWTTSSKSVATVDENGVVTIHKTGSVTITATAQDGTNKKATFKIKVLRKAANELFFENAKNVVYDEAMGCNVFAIAGGKTLTIKPVLYDTDWKKVSVTFGWDIELISPDYGTAFVKKFSKGTLNTAAVTETKYARVTVKVPVDYVGWDYNEAKLDDQGYLHCEIIVAIYPATTSLQIVDENGKPITGKLWNEKYGPDICLGVQTNAGAAQGWTWKSSNEKLAIVDQNGVVTYNTEYDKYGTVTITATAKDGTGKSHSIQIYYDR